MVIGFLYGKAIPLAYFSAKTHLCICIDFSHREMFSLMVVKDN